jgi:osmotically-inducible protein OsmY
MNDRQTGEGRQDRWTTQGERQDEGNGRSQRELTRSSQTGREMEQQGESSSGNWSGYVVPYRYYGPGYRGVGYYSVFYQGADDQEGGPGWGDEQTGRNVQRGETGQRSGRFAGRGPKGYQRSDERIREDVSDRLMANDRLDASDIEVEVKDCEVTLTGTVTDRWSKRLAEDLAEQVMGVREVMNQVRVASESGRYGQTDQPSRGDQAEFGQVGKSSRAPQGSSTEEPARGDANGRRQKTASAPR